ncbi:THO complex subunit 7 homolog [Lingula anatina]|uniref:THO complex subunit 7 homolog n=1 Tax=Lingula anatina TaxID=7574 RepID=A0A1S3JWJ1_LINAN|nr:THO complex subunit 7 homolog [Lingula anatina]|eukprot:XP_013414672.1 THO complex subunit 7 homolog [Lingula anatina]
MATDDDIIRKRLLIEGDGGNDDRRIGSLLKMFIKWCNSTDDTPEESLATEQRMLATLSQCEMAMEKSVIVHRMNLKEQENYQGQNKRIESSIQDALEKISECKNELQTAKRVRRNRQQYDALARVIADHPDRKDTMKQLEALDKEMESLKETKETLEQKLSLRRKQFHVLITALQEMQRILEVDEHSTEQASTETSMEMG